jgi:hypothetical protein
MAVGLLEAFGLIEQYGKSAHDDGIVTTGDLLFCADAKKRRGCRSVQSKLSGEEIDRVILIGKKIKNWRKK